MDLRDQVGSYRVIVSYETELLEAFSLCILQQHNCFNCDAKIIADPVVPVLKEWRGEPLTQAAARDIFIGHLDHVSYRNRRFNEGGEEEQSAAAAVEQPVSDGDACGDLPWSWKVVCGANPAYDAFPAQHQLFYPAFDRSGKPTSALWYDPCFKVRAFLRLVDQLGKNSRNLLTDCLTA